MNKNKKIVKAMSSVLCASMLMGSVTPVFAATTDTQTTSNETDSKSVEVTYDKSASYFVTIPKIIALDSNKESTYSVKVEGDIPSDKNVYVAPVDAISSTDEIDFYMKDQSTKNTKADVVATVTHNKDIWDFEDASSGYEETNNSISALGLSSGEWKGTFNFNINLKDVASGGDNKTDEGNKDEENYGEDVILTSDNLATYGIANTGDVAIPNVVNDGEGVKHKITSIGDSAFMKCDNLTSITIPDSVTSIGTHAFQNCSSLKSITIPDSVTNIGTRAFASCSLTSITIPNSVTSIGEDAFLNYGSVSSIIVDSNNPIYDSRNDCNAIIETSTNTLIQGCKNTIIPNSITSIGYDAFCSCGFTTITIPESVTSIGHFAFDYCSKLSYITYKGKTYTNKTQLTNALSSNGVSVGVNIFNNTKLS